MLENMDQNNSESGHILHSEYPVSLWLMAKVYNCDIHFYVKKNRQYFSVSEVKSTSNINVNNYVWFS